MEDEKLRRQIAGIGSFEQADDLFQASVLSRTASFFLPFAGEIGPRSAESRQAMLAKRTQGTSDSDNHGPSREKARFPGT